MEIADLLVSYVTYFCITFLFIDNLQFTYFV